jgi:hypothetical protein
MELSKTRLGFFCRAQNKRDFLFFRLFFSLSSIFENVGKRNS